MEKIFKTFESFSVNENVDKHYMEDIHQAFDKELDPFPIIMEVTFEEMDEDVYEFNMSESDFSLTTPYPAEESLGWFILRQAIFEALGGKSTWNNKKEESFYITSEGIRSIISKSPQDVNGVAGDKFVTVFKNIASSEELFIALDNLFFKPYKMYQAVLR